MCAHAKFPKTRCVKKTALRTPAQVLREDPRRTCTQPDHILTPRPGWMYVAPPCARQLSKSYSLKRYKPGPRSCLLDKGTKRVTAKDSDTATGNEAPARKKARSVMSANNSFAKLLKRECHRRGNTAFSRNSAQVRQDYA